MRRTRRDEILYWAYPSRIKAIEATAAVLRRAGSPEALAAAAAELKSMAGQLTPPASGIRYHQVAILLEALTFLVRWVAAVRSAEIDADRFLRSAKLAARDVSRELAGNAEDESLGRVASRISDLSDVDGFPDIARLLLCIPLPLPLFAEVQRPFPHDRTPAAPAKAPAVVVAFTSFQLNGVAFGDPHTIQPDILYDLEVAVRVSHWPPVAQRLVLEVMSVEPPSAYALPTFSFHRPTGSAPFAVTQTGRLLVHHPIALYARPLQFTYKARFEPSDAESQVSVEGHRHLRMQCFDPAREPQSGYALVDTRVLAIRDQVRSRVSVPDRELNDFLVLLTALGGIAGQSLQSNIFPRQYPEEEFQKELTKLLRQNPRIGSALEEHPRAARGVTDLSFHGTRLELKSEQDQFVTAEAASVFIPQTAQYVSGSDRRLGILCILDCSAKTQAPGLVENDIFLVPVPPPGGNGAPVLIAVVIIRGNLPRPSDLSR
jgi:hypothetical protein